MLPDAKFCSNCGAPVVSGASVVPANETPAERRDRERREDFERAWGGSDGTSGRDPSATPQDDEGAEHQDEWELLDRGPSASPQDDDDSAGGFATKRATWEVERERLQSGQLDDEWSMSNLGPAKPQRRRTWLWVLLGLVVALVLACCIGGWWLIFTDSGQNFIDNIEATQTAIVQNSTEPAATPKP